jgi:hypothetical protein
VGIQALVVSVGIVAALVLGIWGASFDNLNGAGWLVIAVVPAVWAAVRLTERLIGRDIWEYTAPYPDTSMLADNDVARREEALEALPGDTTWAENAFQPCDSAGACRSASAIETTAVMPPRPRGSHAIAALTEARSIR